MTGYTPKQGAGKAGRVSPRRELAVVTLAAVASISGVGGLLAAGQHAAAPTRFTNGSASTLSSPTRPQPDHGHIAVAPSSYRGGDREETDEEVGPVFKSTNRVGNARQNGNVTHVPTPHARHSALSRGSAPVN